MVFEWGWLSSLGDTWTCLGIDLVVATGTRGLCLTKRIVSPKHQQYWCWEALPQSLRLPIPTEAWPRGKWVWLTESGAPLHFQPGCARRFLKQSKGRWKKDSVSSSGPVSCGKTRETGHKKAGSSVFASISLPLGRYSHSGRYIPMSEALLTNSGSSAMPARAEAG